MAATEPTLSTAIDYSVAPAYLRTVNCTTAGQFTTALADAQFGDKIVLTAGTTYTGEFVLKVPTGTLAGTGGDNWVTIISSSSSIPAAGTRVTISDITNMPTIVASAGSASNKAISASAEGIHHYRFVGLNFTTPNNAVGGIVYIAPVTDYSLSANYPHHISLERCVIKPQYDYGTNFAVTIHGANIQVIDCHFDECKRQGAGGENDGEAKAFFQTFDSGPTKIHNNYMAGCGSTLFIGDSLKGGVTITTGYQYKQPHDITVTNNHFDRKLQWKSDDATYIPCCDLAGTGTVSSSSTTVTFGTSQSGLIGTYVKGATSGAVGKITAGSGTSWTIAWRSGTAFSAGESWRYNSNDLSSKNLVEFKAGNKVYINGNTFERFWNAGQYFALTLTPRSYGWFADWTVTNNYFNNCCGPINFSVGDSEAGNGLGASPYASARIRFSNNLVKDLNSTAMSTLSSNSYTWAISPFASLFGCLNGFGGTIAAGATTGTGVTFTATGTPFADEMVGQRIQYSTGRATITAYTDSNHVTADITTAFPDTSTHAANLWFVGPASIVGTSVFHWDSLIIEHNTIAGANCNNQKTPGIVGNPDTTTLGTNIVWRNNLLYTVQGGFGLDGPAYVGTNAINYFAESATKDIRNNVMFGPDLVGGGINYQQNYNGEAVDEVLAFFNDETTIGFVDYAGGNFRVTGTYATAATDGTMIGCNIDTLEAAISGVTPAATGFRYLPIRWP